MKRIVDSILITGPVWAALLFLGAHPAAEAKTPSPHRALVTKVRVSYADLDLTREADVQTLLGRIENAAYRACGGNPRRHPGYGLMPRRTEAAFRECREDAAARAVDEVNAPVLALAHVQTVGK